MANRRAEADRLYPRGPGVAQGYLAGERTTEGPVIQSLSFLAIAGLVGSFARQPLRRPSVGQPLRHAGLEFRHSEAVGGTPALVHDL